MNRMFYLPTEANKSKVPKISTIINTMGYDYSGGIDCGPRSYTREGPGYRKEFEKLVEVERVDMYFHPPIPWKSMVLKAFRGGGWIGLAFELTPRLLHFGFVWVWRNVGVY